MQLNVPYQTPGPRVDPFAYASGNASTPYYSGFGANSQMVSNLMPAPQSANPFAVTPVSRAAGSPASGESTDYFQDPMGVADSGPITSDTMAKGKDFNPSEAAKMLKEVGKGTVRNVKNIAQGVAETPYNLAGAPVDVATMAMRPFGYKEEKPVGGSEWIKEKATAMGIRPEAPTDPNDRIMHGLGEIGSSLVNPAPAAKAVGSAAEMLSKLPGAALEEATRPMSAYERQRGIMRIPGGEFPTKGANSGTEIGNQSTFKSKLDEGIDHLLARFSDAAHRNPEVKETAEAASQFIDTKLRNWYTKQASSVSDPVREALITGRIKIPKNSDLEEKFPQALIDAARKGDSTAMKLLENQYDNMLSVSARQIIPEGMSHQHQADMREAYRNSVLQSMKDNPSTIPDTLLLRLAKKDVAALSPQQASQEAANIRAKLAQNPNLFNTILEPTLERMVSKNSYSMPNFVRQSSFENSPETNLALNATEATRTGRAPAIDIDYANIDLFGLGMFDLRDTVMQMDPKELSRMSVPDFLGKALQIKNRGNEAESAASLIKKYVASNRKLPPAAAMFGTKELLPADSQGFQWREIVDPMATKVQSAMMDNSIEGYSRFGTYGSAGKGITAMKNGDVRLFSLYSPEGHAVSNVEYLTDKYKGNQLGNSIPQFTGNGLRTKNEQPTNYGPQILDLINYLKPDKVDTRATSVLEDTGLIHDVDPNALTVQFPRNRR